MASDINLTVSGTKDAIMMVEAGAKEVPENEMLDAIMFGHEEIKKLCVFIEEIVAEVGKEKMEYKVFKASEEVDQAVREYATDKMVDAIKTFDKQERLANMDAVDQETQEHFAEIFPEGAKEVADVLYNIRKEEVRRMILDEGVRPDNRKLTEIRPLWSETGFLPRAHGTGLFKRGQTQVLSVATLAPLSEAQYLDSIDIDVTRKRYMHQYNFPGYCTGEARMSRSPGRREIGHGALAERALLPVIPSEEEFPYAIRVVSEVLSSNGSSSMASTCGSCLALMDAGVPIKKPVSGIAMGLIEGTNPDGSFRHAILSDIQGMEDFLGDMDFKVTGTKDGITATQMDIKVDGLSYEVLAAALEQARKGRLHILGKITECIAEPREDYKPFVPRIVQITIPQDMIGAVIGPGGKVIQDIQKTTGTTITITEVDNKGIVDIFGQDKTALDGALNRIKAIVAIPEIGETYHGKIRSIVTFGAFVEIMPGKDALLHISEIDYKRFETMEETGLKEGDEIDVKLIGMDPKTNKLKLSRKVLLPKPEGYVERERRPRGDRPERGERHERHGRPERKEE